MRSYEKRCLCRNNMNACVRVCLFVVKVNRY